MALTKCKECGHDVSTTAAMCPNCGAPDFLPDGVKEERKPTTGSSAKKERNRKRPQVSGKRQESPARTIGAAGVILLFIGVFMPILNVPLMGSVNYFNNGKGDGTIIVALAVLSMISILARSYGLLFPTGIFALGMLILTYVKIQNRLSGVTADLERELAGNPFAGIATNTLSMVQIQWGWAVLIIGAVLLLVAAGVDMAKR